MGLREKVALLILAIILIQVMDGQCVPYTDKFKSLKTNNKNKLRQNTKTTSTHHAKEESINKIFNFPEVEYPLTSRLFSNQNNDLILNETPKSQSEYVNSPPKKTSKKRKYEHKMNSKNSKVTVPPLLESTPKHLSFKDEYVFPSVDYPLDVTDLWAPHYWNHIPSILPEVKNNVKESNIITKATKEIAKIPKGPKNTSNIKLDSVFVTTNQNDEDMDIESLKSLDNKEDMKAGKESVKNDKSIIKVTPSHNNCVEPSSKFENKNKKSGSVSTANNFNTTTGTDKSNQCVNDISYIKINLGNSSKNRAPFKSLDSADHVPFFVTIGPQDDFIKPIESTSYQSCQTLTTAQPTSSYIFSSIENVYNELSLTAQITPSPIVETSSYCNEPIKTTTMLLTYTPLTTVPPATDEHFFDIKDQLLFNSTNAELKTNSCNNNETEESENEDAESADDMGYTIMYPEVLNSLTTSTRSPIVSKDVDNNWMYPELDNHTLNTYSDEVEQYYILVS